MISEISYRFGRFKSLFQKSVFVRSQYRVVTSACHYADEEILAASHATASKATKSKRNA